MYRRAVLLISYRLNEAKTPHRKLRQPCSPPRCPTSARWQLALPASEDAEILGLRSHIAHGLQFQGQRAFNVHEYIGFEHRRKMLKRPFSRRGEYRTDRVPLLAGLP